MVLLLFDETRPDGSRLGYHIPDAVCYIAIAAARYKGRWQPNADSFFDCADDLEDHERIDLWLVGAC